MQYLLDCANAPKVSQAMNVFPVVGVTTNPTYISREKSAFLPIVKGLRKVVKDKMLFVQTLSHEAEGIVKEALALQALLGEPFYAKIPVTADGIKAIRMLDEQGCKSLGTAVFTPQQALLCARAGASFVAPYVNRLDAVGIDGVAVVSQIVETLLNAGVETEVLAAGFKTTRQVQDCALAGVGYATMTPELLFELALHPLTNDAIELFDQDWHHQYGYTTTLDWVEKGE